LNQETLKKEDSIIEERIAKVINYLEKHKDKKRVTTERTFADRKVPIIGFSREGNWNSLIPEIAKPIVS